MEFAVYLMPANIVIGDNILRSINDWLNGELPVPFVTYDYDSAKEYLLSGHGVMFVTYNDGASEILEYN